MGKMSGGNDSTSKSMMTGDMKSDKDQSQKKSVSLDGGEEVIGISSCHGQSVEKNGDDQSKNRQEDEENGGFIHPFASVDELDPAISAHLHFLESFQAGKSKVELLAAKIEKRRKERIPVTFSARVEFLKTCRSIAVMKGYEKKTWIHYFDLLEYQRRVRQEVGSGCKPFKGLSKIEKYLRVINDKQCLLDVLDQAVYVVEKIQLEDNDWFHYQDFNFFHTYLASRWPWRRHRTLSAASTVLLFYIFSPILLCAIMKDQNICPSDANSLEMIRNALYFSSTTMSTVGYGDFTVENDQPWKVFIGMLYMILAMYVAITAFRAAAESAFSPIKGALERLFRVQYPTGPFKDREYLYQRIQKIRVIKYIGIASTFITMNLIFVFAVSLHFWVRDEGASEYNWMDAFYVAVQTTTTIGYGDYTIPEEMRWFQIIYLTISTYLVGNALGKLGNLHSDLEQVRRYHAWHRRDVNKYVIHYLASSNDPHRVDQFEFAIASLLDLGKISGEDLRPIMDKYRSLAERSGQTGYIEVADVPEESEMELDNNLEKTEGAEGT